MDLTSCTYPEKAATWVFFAGAEGCDLHPPSPLTQRQPALRQATKMWEQGRGFWVAQLLRAIKVGVFYPSHTEVQPMLPQQLNSSC